jgi:hypothetical protein
MFWWLKRPRRYIEPLPKDLDPKSPEARAFWYRTPQNKRRFRLGCASYCMIVSIVMGIYWFTTTYSVQRIQVDTSITQTAKTGEAIPTDTPTPTEW